MELCGYLAQQHCNKTFGFGLVWKQNSDRSIYLWCRDQSKGRSVEALFPKGDADRTFPRVLTEPFPE